MLTKVVGVGGRKGGSGKTTISHMVATGLAFIARLNDQEGLTPDTIVSLLVTDPDSEVPSPEGRYFECVDARDSKEADRIIVALDTAPDPIAMVIDSAARQVELDVRLVKGADIFLLPVTPDDDSGVKAIKDLLFYRGQGMEESRIWIVPNNWTASPAIRAEIEQKLFEGLSAWDGGKGWKNIMSPIFSKPTLNRLTRLDDPGARRDQVRSCVDLTRDILLAIDGKYQPYTGFVTE